MNLIEELGIEKARAIVDGAPDWADIFCISSDDYFRADGGEIKCCIFLKDLRTAIADHDQHLSEQREKFEAAYSLKFPESKVTLLPNGNYSGWIKQKKWKDWQAKQQQLQTELNNCSAKDSSEISITDHCTDIRNHISPLTGVIEQ